MQTKEPKVQTSLRIDEVALSEAKAILSEIGMNFSEAVNIFTKMIVRHRGLPFDVRLPDPQANDLTSKLRTALEEVERIEQEKASTISARDFLNEL
jgi:DNA-damage-inducible protein J